MFLFPLQAPLAVQGFTVLLLLQVRVADCPTRIEVGLMDKFSVGPGGGGGGVDTGPTVTVLCA